MSTWNSLDQIGSTQNSSRTLDYEDENGDSRVRDIVISRSLEQDGTRRYIDVNAVLGQCKEEIWSGSQNDCPICLQKLEPFAKIFRLPCDHIFHRDCLTPWIKDHHDQCPVCRAEILLGSHQFHPLQESHQHTLHKHDVPILNVPPTYDVPILNIPPTHDVPICNPPTHDVPILNPPTHDVPIIRTILPPSSRQTLLSNDNENIHPQTIPIDVTHNEHSGIYNVQVHQNKPSRQAHDVLHTSMDNVTYPLNQNAHPSHIETTSINNPTPSTNDNIYPRQLNTYDVPIMTMNPNTPISYIIPIEENFSSTTDHTIHPSQTQHVNNYPIHADHIHNVPIHFTRVHDGPTSRIQQESPFPQSVHTLNGSQSNVEGLVFTTHFIILNPKRQYSPTHPNLTTNDTSSQYGSDQSMKNFNLLFDSGFKRLGRL